MTTASDQELAEEDDLGSADPLAVDRVDTQPPSYRHVRRFRTTATLGVSPAASCFDCCAGTGARARTWRSCGARSSRIP